MKTHRDEEIAMTDAVADHAEYGRNQCSDELERSKYGEQEHRSGFNQDIPAEHQRLDLERPRGEQVGGPLEAIVADAEWRERRTSCCAQGATARVTAIPCPCDFFSFPAR